MNDESGRMTKSYLMNGQWPLWPPVAGPVAWNNIYVLVALHIAESRAFRDVRCSFTNTPDWVFTNTPEWGVCKGATSALVNERENVRPTSACPDKRKGRLL